MLDCIGYIIYIGLYRMVDKLYMICVIYVIYVKIGFNTNLFLMWKFVFVWKLYVKYLCYVIVLLCEKFVLCVYEILWWFMDMNFPIQYK